MNKMRLMIVLGLLCAILPVRAADNLQAFPRRRGQDTLCPATSAAGGRIRFPGGTARRQDRPG